MIKKIINGAEVICSDEEERLIRMQWALNDQYPEYSGHLAFDGVSEPYHVMEDCKAKHRQLISFLIGEKVNKINSQLEIAEENYDEELKKILVSKRKSFKSHAGIDLSSIIKIEDLKRHLDIIKSL